MYQPTKHNVILSHESIIISYIRFVQDRDNPNYSKIIYSVHNSVMTFSINNLYVYLPIIMSPNKTKTKPNKILTPTILSKYYTFKSDSSNNNNKIIESVCNMEIAILEKFNSEHKNDKIAVRTINNLLSQKFLKINVNSNVESTQKVCIKLCGIWENQIEYGITFKIFMYE